MARGPDRPPPPRRSMLMVVLVLIGVALVAAVIISFFVRRHGESDAPLPGWTPTDEVFRDPGTDRMMRVWVDAAEERHYVPDGRH